MKLYELAQQYRQVQEMDFDPETLKEVLESIECTIEEKADNITKLMKELEASAEAKKAEAKRLSEASAADLKKVDDLKEYLRFNLAQAGINKLDTGLFKISFRKGSEVVMIDEESLPDRIGVDGHWVDLKKEETIIKVMSKPELKKVLRVYGEIPGVSLVRNPDTLQIK